MTKLRIATAVLLWAVCGLPLAEGQCELEKLIAADGAASDRFGHSVSVNGNVALVGAQFDDNNGIDSGSAYVYRFDGVSWLQEQKLLAADGAQSDQFGISVSVSGDVALIGAFGDDDIGSSSGSAYVYRFDGTSWIQEQKLLAADSAAGDDFGGSVSVSGDVALVGAVGDDDHGTSSGSAYVYRYDGVSWTQEQKLLAADGALIDLFGISVSVSGNVALVGANRDDDNGSSSGSAYVYRYDGASWFQEQKLLASDGAANDFFGFSVSISGDVALAGAWHDDNSSGFDAGSAYLYRYDGVSWVQEQKLLAADGAPSDVFGKAVSISGDVALVGAYLDDDSGTDSGSAYLYHYDGASWIQELKILAADGSQSDSFGDSLSVSGDVALVGAFLDDDNGGDSGSAYLYAVPGGADCNVNGMTDLCDLDSGTSLDLNLNGIPDECDDDPFRRSDCNGSGADSIADAFFFLGFLFGGGATPSCDDACDSNDDGVLDISDPVMMLNYLFFQGAPPPEPLVACGDDPTTAADPLGCAAFGACP